VRLLVVDPSGILAWLVEHAVSPAVEVEAVTSLEEAERVVRERPPEGAVVSMSHAELPWARFQHLCASSHPPIPVLYESCVFACARDAGIDPDDGVAMFLRKPVPFATLHAALVELLAHRGAPLPRERLFSTVGGVAVGRGKSPRVGDWGPAGGEGRAAATQWDATGATSTGGEAGALDVGDAVENVQRTGSSGWPAGARK
jgi:hypothetical protein